ncbi:uncharacterized protein LOC144453138 [Glandiceps talaboti]
MTLLLRIMVLCLSMSFIPAMAKFDLSQLSWEVEEQLAEMELQGLHEITAQPMPIFRKDLPGDYIAYWEIELNGTDYVILSSSAKTGDYRRTLEGPVPSPSTLMRKRARLVKSRCERYFMLSPDGQMFCEDGKGRIVASTMEILGNIGDQEKNTKRKRVKMEILIRQELDELQEEWDRRQLKVDRSAIWSTMLEYDDIPERYEEHGVLAGFHGDSYWEEAISPGDDIQIPMNKMVTEVKIKVVPFDMNLTKSDIKIWQHKLCKILLDVCKKEDPITVDVKKISINEKGRKMLALALHGDREYVIDVLDGRQVGFNLEIHLKKGKVILKRFGIDLTSVNRSKRHTRTKAWSEWTYSSIHEEQLFPDYWQHQVGKCTSGCGPVAWAMVFGYYDRLAHSDTPHGHSKALWRCDDGGLSGSEECVAPATFNNQVRQYVEEIRGELDTFCLLDQGATPQWNMDHVEGFYCDRQGDSAYISTINTGGLHGFLGAYSDQVAKTVINSLSPNGSQLPVIIGYRIGGNIVQHYAVATKLRRRSRRYRHCVLWWCENWKTEWDNDIFIHLGGQKGDGNAWHSCEAFFGAVAYPFHTADANAGIGTSVDSNQEDLLQ